MVLGPDYAPCAVRVGLNLLFLVPGETGGTEVVARELIPRLVAAAPDLSFTAFVNRETARAGEGPWGDVIPAVTVPVRSSDRLQWIFGEQLLLPRLAERHGMALVHSLANTAPARGRFRRVVTVHDLIHRVRPEAHFGARALGMRGLVSLAVRRSDRVIAVSESTRADLVRYLRLAPERIDVVAEGPGAAPAAGPVGEGDLRSTLALRDRRVLLSVSAKRPHKNLGRLLRALAALPSAERPVLVLPGYPTEHQAELEDLARGLGIDGDVRFLGWVSPETLEGLYALAAAFVYPSLYEGFGLPVLEAMARGVPIACSSTGAVAEVAGDAALRFDPQSEREIAAAVSRILSDARLAEDLIGRGRARASQYTWERTAQGTVASYRRALSGRPSPPA